MGEKRTVYPLSCISDINDPKIAFQNYDGREHVDPKQRSDVCECDLEYGHYGVENVFRNIGPSCFFFFLVLEVVLVGDLIFCE